MQEVSTRSGGRSIELTPIKSRTIEDKGRFVPVGGSRQEADVCSVLNGIFELAISSNASDIHFEFDDIDGLSVRTREGGDLSFMTYSLAVEPARLARAKICAKTRLDDQERLVPQDGRMMVFFCGRRVDVRVAITPMVSGFKIVCRLLDSNNSNQDIDTLDMPFSVRHAMKRVAEFPEGIVLLSGPTGSGKTTTLYAIMQHLNDPGRHIVTIENPVEYAIKSFTQIDVDGNMTFAKAMKSSLRLDPDVIMVGEIRDEESASIAIMAGSSGHMVLSTVHANNAAETLTRLMSFGLKSFEVSSVISSMIAQRLLPKIDPRAEILWGPPNEIEAEWLKRRNLYFPDMKFPTIAEGTYSFKGRVPIVEMVEMSAPMRTIMESSDGSDNWLARLLEQAVNQPQFESLAQAGVRVAQSGKTTLAEVIKATSDIGYITSSMRFEQSLIYQGIITSEELDMVQSEIQQIRQTGKIVKLEDHLVSSGVCSQIEIESAKVTAQASA